MSEKEGQAQEKYGEIQLPSAGDLRQMRESFGLGISTVKSNCGVSGIAHVERGDHSPLASNLKILLEYYSDHPEGPATPDPSAYVVPTGEMLRDIREDCGYDLNDDWGSGPPISKHSIRCWERGKNSPILDNLAEVLQFYGVTVSR